MLLIIKYYKAPVILTGALFFLALLSVSVQAQESVIQSDFEHKVNLYDVNGKPWINSNIDATGTPFFNEKWEYGKLRVNGNTITNMKLRLNLQTQEVHFMQSDTEMVLPNGLVREVTLFDSTANPRAIYTFQCGFPAIDNQGAGNFYLVLCNGRIKFVEALVKSIRQEKDNLSGETTKEYRQYEDYYFLPPGESKLIRFKRDKSVLTFMKDKDSQVEAFMSKNKLSFKSAADIKKAVDYYNSLF